MKETPRENGKKEIKDEEESFIKYELSQTSWKEVKAVQVGGKH